jgi:hypothetical protein
MSPLIEGMKTFAMECVPSLAMLVDHVTYTRHLEGEKATLEQEVEELRCKLRRSSHFG